MRTEEHGFWGDKRTEEQVFLKDMRTREHVFWGETREQKNMFFGRHENKRTWEEGQGLIEQNENKRFGWALPNTPFLRYPHLNHWILHFSLFTFHLTYGFFTFHSSLNISFACSFHRTQTTQKLFLFYYALRGNRNNNVSLRLQKSHIFNNVFHDA